MIDIMLADSVASDHPLRARVLLVEDDSTLRGYLTDCLEVAGYAVIASSNGLEGWRAFDVQRPDIVVVDLDLPVMSGFRLLHLVRREVRPDGRPFPMIITTGYDLQEAHDLVVDVRPDAYLKKPFSADALTRSVRQLLTRPEKPHIGEQK